MIHFSCDRCRRTIDGEELRFTVSIEIQVALEDKSLDLPEDEIDVLHEVLDELNEEEREEVNSFAYQRQQHDMCLECHREYLANPLGCELPSRVGFSEN